MWKPGEEKPLNINLTGKKKKKNKKKKKLKNKGNDSGKRQLDSFDEQGKDKVSVPNLYSKDPVPSSSSKPIKVSDSLSRLKFMSRKKETQDRHQEEANRKRKIDQERWVIPRDEVEGRSQNNERLVCIPMETNPTRATLSAHLNSRRKPVSGRRSFGNFNKKVDTYNQDLELSEKDREVAQYVDDNAIDKEEMAAFFGNKQKQKKRRTM